MFRRKSKRSDFGAAGQSEKNWKFSAADVKERKCWDDYQSAYEKMIGTRLRACAVGGRAGGQQVVQPAAGGGYRRGCAIGDESGVSKVSEENWRS